jgi:hypothetical protein
MTAPPPRILERWFRAFIYADCSLNVSMSVFLDPKSVAYKPGELWAILKGRRNLLPNEILVLDLFYYKAAAISAALDVPPSFILTKSSMKFLIS